MTEAGWTSNVPANEGEYWFRSGGVRKPIVAHVYLDVEQDLRIIIGINDLYVTDLDGFDEFDGAEFLGPITPDSYQQGRVAGLGDVKRYVERQIKIGEDFIGGPDPNIQRRVALDEVIEYCDRQLAQAAQDEKGVGDVHG